MSPMRMFTERSKQLLDKKALQAQHYAPPLHDAITTPQSGLGSKDFLGPIFGYQFFLFVFLRIKMEKKIGRDFPVFLNQGPGAA